MEKIKIEAGLFERAKRAAERFCESTLAPRYNDYFRSLLAPAEAPADSAIPRIVERIAPFFAQKPCVEDFPKLSPDTASRLLS